MVLALHIIYWLCISCVVYTYFIYPFGIWAVARLFGRPIRLDGPLPGSISVVVSVYNEQGTIGRRLDELIDLVAPYGHQGEVIVVSDGSIDRTVEIVSRYVSCAPVRLIELPVNQGKAVALSRGAEVARGEILVFADARQRWAPDALERLLVNFRDPRVGAVGGDLVIETSPGILAGIGIYWRLEKWLRIQESRLHSTVVLTGAIGAVRRSLFPPLPTGTITDDMYWPAQVSMAGYRVLHDGSAKAYDRLPARAQDEMRRKLRTLCGNFQLFGRMPSILLPWRNPVWIQLISHKLMRLAVPWAMLGAFVTNFFLEGSFYRLTLGFQVAFYSLSLIGILSNLGLRSRFLSGLGAFLTMNVVAWYAFWVWASGHASQSWGKVAYNEDVAEIRRP